MAFRLLDEKGKPLPKKGRTSRRPAFREEQGGTVYHYEIFVRINCLDGKVRDIRKRLWLPNDITAQVIERELKTGHATKKMTWAEAHRQWLDGNKGKFSDGHAANSVVTIRKWCERFGVESTIEGTTLAQFSSWCEEICLKGKGRGGQIRRAHLLAIARWCRDRGLVKEIPFEHSPKPAARLEKRRAASLDEFLAIAEAMPSEMIFLWRMLGLTGMRLSAACGVREDGITDTSFIVLTKFRREVLYPITPMVADVITDARRFKSERGIVSDFLFTREDGKPWVKDRFHNRLKSLIKAKSLPDITSHQLRHMGGTLLAKNNYNRDIIAAGLAHEDEKSSATYIDKDMEMRRTALMGIEGAVKDVYFLSISDTKTVQAANNERRLTPPTTSELDAAFTYFLRSILNNPNK